MTDATIGRIPVFTDGDQAEARRNKTMAKISKTAALKVGNAAVCAPIGQNGGGVKDWLIIGPWKDAEPEGARTEARASSYPSALHVRAAWIASVALHTMRPKWGEDESYAISAATEKCGYEMTARAILNRALEILA